MNDFVNSILFCSNCSENRIEVTRRKDKNYIPILCSHLHTLLHILQVQRCIRASKAATSEIIFPCVVFFTKWGNSCEFDDLCCFLFFLSVKYLND